MNTKTRILVFRSKDILISLIATLVLIFIIIALIVSIGHMSLSTEKPVQKTNSTGKYNPGIYTSTITLGGNPVELSVCVDKDSICSISFVNLNEYVSTMYPLLDDILEELSSQIYITNSTKNVTYNSSSQYTSELLLKAIDEALKKAQ